MNELRAWFLRQRNTTAALQLDLGRILQRPQDHSRGLRAYIQV